MLDDFAAPTPFATINSTGVDFEQMNKGVTPLFFMETVQDHRQTEKEGRPIFVQVEHVRIIVAGDMLNSGVSPVTPELMERFHDQYRRWKENREGAAVVDGTPLSQWSLLSAVQVKEFESLHVFSVEHLAGIPDTILQRMPDGRLWREKAKAWLASTKDASVATRYAAENERMRDDMEQLKKTIATMEQKITSMTPTPNNQNANFNQNAQKNNHR